MLFGMKEQRTFSRNSLMGFQEIQIRGMRLAWPIHWFPHECHHMVIGQICDSVTKDKQEKTQKANGQKNSNELEVEI
jgi:hypothetical protein